MPNIKTVSFEVAAEDAEQRDDEDMILIEMKDKTGVSLRSSILLRRPTQGEFARLTLAMGRTNDLSVMVPSFNHFLTRIIIEPDDAREYEELKDREDLVGLEWLWDLVEDRGLDFDLSDLMQLILDFMEQFTGFPTKPSSASTSSRRTPGTSSTAGSRRAGSTRSRSTPAASRA